MEPIVKSLTTIGYNYHESTDLLQLLIIDLTMNSLLIFCRRYHLIGEYSRHLEVLTILFKEELNFD